LESPLPHDACWYFASGTCSRVACPFSHRSYADLIAIFTNRRPLVGGDIERNRRLWSRCEHFEPIFAPLPQPSDQLIAVLPVPLILRAWDAFHEPPFVPTMQARMRHVAAPKPTVAVLMGERAEVGGLRRVWGGVLLQGSREQVERGRNLLIAVMEQHYYRHAAPRILHTNGEGLTAAAELSTLPAVPLAALPADIPQSLPLSPLAGPAASPLLPSSAESAQESANSANSKSALSLSVPMVSTPRYVAHCSIPLSAAVCVIVSHVDCPAAPNPFHVDFVHSISAVCQKHVDAPLDGSDSASLLSGADPRPLSYITLAAYRLLRHLIPHTDDVASAAQQTSCTAPPSSAASMDVTLTAMSDRIGELCGTGEVASHAVRTCEDVARHDSTTLLTVDAFVQPLLRVDSSDDAQQMSEWQRWLVGSVTWQRLTGAVMEYVVAELVQLLAAALIEERTAWCDAGQTDDGDWQRSRVACLHDAVLAVDPELRSLWLAIGMPAECPASLRTPTDLQCAYKQQFEHSMRAAVVASAPWMFDARLVQQRVNEWVHGRLDDGDAHFFRRYHIRPLWHTGADLRGYEVKCGWQPQLWCPMRAAFELVDAAGVSRRIDVTCSMTLNDEREPLAVAVQVWDADHNILMTHSHQHEFGAKLTVRCELQFPHKVFRSVINGRKNKNRKCDTHCFADYLCHGHVHGLTHEQWREAMGSRLQIEYGGTQCWRDRLEIEQERADDEQAAAGSSRDTLFPSRLADVTDRKQYRYRQRTEIRRMVAIAVRAAMLDTGVDVAVFPSLQPAEMQRQFKVAMQSRLETDIAQLPATLPRDLQEIVMEYHRPHVDIPL